MAVQPKPDCHKSYSVERSVGRRLVYRHAIAEVPSELLHVIFREFGNDLTGETSTLAIDHRELLGTVLAAVNRQLVSSKGEQAIEIAEG
jgi:hypothetical protein